MFVNAHALGTAYLQPAGAWRRAIAARPSPPRATRSPSRARVNKVLGPAPLSFSGAKRLLQLAVDADRRSAMGAESLAQTALRLTDDHHEGLAAARERREPVFRGR
jgi:hypothetical protein